MSSLSTIFLLFVFPFFNLNYVQCLAPQCNQTTSQFQGVFIEAFTPLKDNGKLNLDAIAPYAKYIKNSVGEYCLPIAGVLILGVAGEGTSLTLYERKQVTDAWVRECKNNNLTIIVEIGGTNYPDVLELAKYVSKKVAAVITYPEPYYRPNSTVELLNFFTPLAKAAYPAKIFFADLPQFTEVSLNMVKFYAQAQKIKNFGGLKAYITTGEAVQANTGIKDGQVILVYNYLSIRSAFSFCLGASVGPVASIFPKLAVAIQTAVYNGDEVTAFKLQLEINKLANAIVSVKNSEARFTDTTDVTHRLPLLKTAMNIVTNVTVGPVRCPPLQQPTSAEINQIKINLENLGYNEENYYRSQEVYCDNSQGQDGTCESCNGEAYDSDIYKK